MITGELLKLRNYLQLHDYNYYVYDRDLILDSKGEVLKADRHQVIVYSAEGEEQWDAICQTGSYGFEKGLLEAEGDIVSGEESGVAGSLTADNIIDKLESTEYRYGKRAEKEKRIFLIAEHGGSDDKAWERVISASDDWYEAQNIRIKAQQAVVNNSNYFVDIKELHEPIREKKQPKEFKERLGCSKCRLDGHCSIQIGEERNVDKMHELCEKRIIDLKYQNN